MWEAKIINHSVDILIPCKNESKYLPALFDSLKNLIIPENFHVRIVFADNNSSDNTLVMIKNFDIQNKIVISHNVDLGTRNNLIFLLEQVTSDFFMFIDAHDYITQNYLLDFHNELKLNHNHNLAYIGKIVSLVEVGSKFKPTEIQNLYVFSRFKKIRVLQLVLFLFHNSIYHSIFPINSINKNLLKKTKGFTLDHLITQSGLGLSNLRYLKKSYYVRRYRRIVGPNFTHLVNGEPVTRHDRAVVNNYYTDQYINSDYFNLIEVNHGKFLSTLCYILISGKYKVNIFADFFYRFTRLIFSRIIFINPIKSQSETIPSHILDEINLYEASVEEPKES